MPEIIRPRAQEPGRGIIITVNKDALSGNRFTLSGNALKIIAIIAKTIDHIAWMGIEEYSQA